MKADLPVELMLEGLVHRLDSKEEQDLRQRYPSLQLAWDNYQIILKLVKERDVDNVESDDHEQRCHSSQH